MEEHISEDKIIKDMEDTRTSLANKLETLEQKVVGTVENAAAAVTDTVDAIKESVHDTVTTLHEGVKESVNSFKNLLDLNAHAQNHPWLVLGGSIGVGYCLGSMLSSSRGVKETSNISSYMSSPEGFATKFKPESASKPGIWASEIAKLKSLALGVVFGTARELLTSSIPEHMGDHVREMLDSVTVKLGGEPIPSSDWQKLHDSPPPEATKQPKDFTSSAGGFENGKEHTATRRW